MALCPGGWYIFPITFIDKIFVIYMKKDYFFLDIPVVCEFLLCVFRNPIISKVRFILWVSKFMSKLERVILRICIYLKSNWIVFTSQYVKAPAVYCT